MLLGFLLYQKNSALCWDFVIILLHHLEKFRWKYETNESPDLLSRCWFLFWKQSEQVLVPMRNKNSAPLESQVQSSASFTQNNVCMSMYFLYLHLVMICLRLLKLIRTISRTTSGFSFALSKLNSTRKIWPKLPHTTDYHSQIIVITVSLTRKLQTCRW